MDIDLQVPAFVPDFLIPNFFNSQVERLAADCVAAPFTWWKDNAGNMILYQAATGMLWVRMEQTGSLLIEEGLEKAEAARFGSLEGWRLPSREEIIRFAKTTDNPIRRGQNFRLYGTFNWLCTQGRISLDEGDLSVDSTSPGHLLFCHEGHDSAYDLILLAMTLGWTLPGSGLEGGADGLVALRHPDIKALLADLDYLPCRLPRLEEALFTDPNKGLWEAWGLSEAEQSLYGLRPRDPGRDVREGFVAIDFGTSSTVVAWDNNGRAELMRVGVKDFWAKEQPRDYENPTVLEFIDFPAMLAAWQSTAYRPGVLWDQVRCSHEALHNWRNNESNPQVVGSIMGTIKRWALRQEKDYRLRITDQENSFEHEFAPLAPRNPVKGQPLEVGNDDEFDPVELYAWFLGMNINWRQRGVFLKYYMTFPVDYPQSVKDNILSAFRRGLQRSLPETLIRQPIFNEFSVEERASEPAAYAAIALPALGIEPGVEDGVAYAVFDFGGGTADFDFGFYRQPTTEEENEDWEAVFERCGAAGDKFLGGENLLENLAYQTFRHNLDLCREKKIAFTRPLDAEDFPGSEMFLEKTRAAATNTLMLIARLRPLWETGTLPNANSGVSKIDLLDREGKKVSCELAISSEILLKYLEQRIEKGVQGFFAAMRTAFGNDLPEHIHILLAGNASRSKLVSDLFGVSSPNAEDVDKLTLNPHWRRMFSPPGENKVESPAFNRLQDYLKGLFGEHSMTFTAHLPLAPDADHVYRPTGKTGVALGLLRLCPGSAIKTIDHARQSSGNEAPFAYHVGRVRKDKFLVVLPQGSPYGEWYELGVPRERVFNLCFTQSSHAHTGLLTEGDIDLKKRPLHLAGDTPSQKVFARAVKPDQIEICTAASKAAAQQGSFENMRLITLD